MPELPAQKRVRYAAQFGLAAYDVMLLTESREKAAYFEQAVSGYGATAKLAANWLNGEIASRLNDEGREFDAVPVPPRRLAGLLARIQDDTVSQKAAKDVLAEMWVGEGEADAIIEVKGLKQISDSGAIERLVDEVLAANVRQVEDFRAGREKAFNSLVGQVMKQSKGKANPAQVNEVLRSRLKG